MKLLLKIFWGVFLTLHSISGLSQKLTLSAGYSPIHFSRGHNLDGLHLHGLNATIAYDRSVYSWQLCAEAVAAQNTETKETVTNIFVGVGYSMRLASMIYSRFQPIMDVAYLASVAQTSDKYVDLKPAIIRGGFGVECYLTDRLAIVPKVQLDYWKYKKTFSYYILSPIVSLQYTL